MIGMMRAKNEERWLSRALKPLLEICDDVFLLDDHSTDRTREIACDMGCTVYPSPFDSLDEARDKTWLLHKITYSYGLPLTRLNIESPYWVICVDGDEELYAGDLKWLVGETRQRELSYSFRILTLYDSEKQIRVDPPYDNMLRPSMFRLISPDLTFKRTKHGGRFHCSNVPAEIGFKKTVHELGPVRLLHYGYMEKEMRERKFEFYLKNDPGHENWYRRECLGVPTLAPLDLA